MPGSEAGFLALRERALALLSTRASATDAEVATHVFGGNPPAALHDRLLGPLRDDPRLARGADGQWRLRRAEIAEATPSLVAAPLAALAMITTGPRPERHRVLSLAAVATTQGQVRERFAATVNPGARVPDYALRRAQVGADTLDDLPPLGPVLDDLLAVLGDHPVCAQEVDLAWEFLDAEARRLGRGLVRPPLLDFNALASHLLDLGGKPSLPLVAARLGVGVVRVGRPSDEARVLAELLGRLLPLAEQRGLRLADLLEAARAPTAGSPLRQGATLDAQPDAPGVYLLRDGGDDVLYVGKARRLRSRLAAYVNRPLGATRRLEGLVGAVRAVEATACDSDLEALIVEDREIRRRQPRFNTQRRVHGARLWLRRPPQPPARRGKRQPAPPRLEVVEGPGGAGEYLGPFRAESLAVASRDLARAVFDLDAARADAAASPAEVPLDPSDSHPRAIYRQRLDAAWAFLADPDADARSAALGAVRRALADAVAARDASRARDRERLLGRVRAYDPTALLLPADPRQARYGVVRPAASPGAVDVFLLDEARLAGRATLDLADVDAGCATLLAEAAPRTAPEERDVVLRWLAAQRPPARLAHLPPDLAPWQAADVLADAARAVAAAASDLAAGQP